MKNSPDDTSAGGATSAPASFAADDILALANGVGTIVAAAVPGSAAVVAAVTGIASLFRNTILPAVQHFQPHELSVVEQATLAAESAAERLRLGIAPAVDN